ncbi:MAG: carbohydrate kinase, YjeF related protein, partial [Xanthomonadaceae bacterium]|nr:carbohydrate kinase, YjeF related protein [Xanthomonadaceae bacterium]
MQHAVALYNSKAIRDVEQAVCASADDAVLIQRAGHAAWRHLLTLWPQAQRVLIVCGCGNNGGDGYALATQVLGSGRKVHVVRLAAPRAASAQRACKAFIAAGGDVTEFDGELPEADLVVDALFGIGLTRAPDAGSSVLIDAINAHRSIIFSLDVPSGVDADSGDVRGAAVSADATLQFIASHCGLFTGAALDHCGRKTVASLDVECDTNAVCARAIEQPALGHWLKPRPLDSHKGKYGHVLCVG